MFDIYTIIFLALAVFIFLRLRSVLGQRTGRERPPYDPYSARDAVRRSTNDNVVALPGRGGEHRQRRTAEPAERWKGIAEAGSSRRRRSQRDRAGRQDLRRQAFRRRRAAAYEMIVTAYAEGDRRTLKNLLSRDVYEGFETAIKDRETKGETAETPLRLDRQVRYHSRRRARPDGACDGALCLAARLGHPRPRAAM